MHYVQHHQGKKHRQIDHAGLQQLAGKESGIRRSCWKLSARQPENKPQKSQPQRQRAEQINLASHPQQSRDQAHGNQCGAI
ncbi:MAG: hypothetical protein JWM83_2195, partial [Candidatus Angelobacter sp.]|nr:hypothetical protein [Candidatus Angelobacter sp.]